MGNIENDPLRIENKKPKCYGPLKPQIHACGLNESE